MGRKRRETEPRPRELYAKLLGGDYVKLSQIDGFRAGGEIPHVMAKIRPEVVGYPPRWCSDHKLRYIPETYWIMEATSLADIEWFTSNKGLGRGRANG